MKIAVSSFIENNQFEYEDAIDMNSNVTTIIESNDERLVSQSHEMRGGQSSHINDEMREGQFSHINDETREGESFHVNERLRDAQTSHFDYETRSEQTSHENNNEREDERTSSLSLTNLQQ